MPNAAFSLIKECLEELERGLHSTGSLPGWLQQPGRSQELHPHLPTWAAGAQARGPPSDALPRLRAEQGAGSEVEQPGHKLARLWDAGTTGDSLTTTPQLQHPNPTVFVWRRSVASKETLRLPQGVPVFHVSAGSDSAPC